MRRWKVVRLIFPMRKFIFVWNTHVEAGGVVVSDEVKMQLHIQMVKQV